MFDHIGLHVRDLGASSEFYEAVLAPLGHTVGARDASGIGIGPAGAPALWLYESASQTNGETHIAFSAQSREAVAAFHAAGLKAGARDHGAPGERADYGPNYYAAFLIDPDGNNVEAVCLAEPG